MSEHVLILDDERAILDVLGQHLEAEGYVCTLCDSPKHAIELLKNGDFDLLLTDIKMPEMSGLDVVRRVSDVNPDLCVIMVTALVDVTNAVKAMRLGADDYVLKPFNLSEISMSVGRALEKRKLVIENRRHHEELERQVGQATADLKKANHYLENLINSAVDAIITIGADERIIFANVGATHMLGRTVEELQSTLISDHYIGGPEEAEYIRRVLRHDQPLQNYETELVHESGKHVPVSVSISIIMDEEGEPESSLAIFKDITEQKRLERELKEMTIRDSLTGLYNQRYFYDRLDAEIERSKRQRRPLSLLLIDVDNFKTYNDSRGHLEGDHVLQEVGKVLGLCTREHVDLGFRYGGDEFTVILPEAPEEQAYRIAQRIRATFEEKHFDLLTLSIGLMTYVDSFSERAFVQFTDSMMYDSKRAGGNRVSVYNSCKQSESDGD